jgi:hypothetical protein
MNGVLVNSIISFLGRLQIGNIKHLTSIKQTTKLGCGTYIADVAALLKSSEYLDNGWLNKLFHLYSLTGTLSLIEIYLSKRKSNRGANKLKVREAAKFPNSYKETYIK